MKMQSKKIFIELVLVVIGFVVLAVFSCKAGANGSVSFLDRKPQAVEKPGAIMPAVKTNKHGDTVYFCGNCGKLVGESNIENLKHYDWLDNYCRECGRKIGNIYR